MLHIIHRVGRKSLESLRRLNESINKQDVLLLKPITTDNLKDVVDAINTYCDNLAEFVDNAIKQSLDRNILSNSGGKLHSRAGSVQPITEPLVRLAARSGTPLSAKSYASGSKLFSGKSLTTEDELVSAVLELIGHDMAKELLKIDVDFVYATETINGKVMYLKNLPNYSSMVSNVEARIKPNPLWRPQDNKAPSDLELCIQAFENKFGDKEYGTTRSVYYPDRALLKKNIIVIENPDDDKYIDETEAKAISNEVISDLKSCGINASPYKYSENEVYIKVNSAKPKVESLHRLNENDYSADVIEVPTSNIERRRAGRFEVTKMVRVKLIKREGHPEGYEEDNVKDAKECKAALDKLIVGSDKLKDYGLETVLTENASVGAEMPVARVELGIRADKGAEPYYKAGDLLEYYTFDFSGGMCHITSHLQAEDWDEMLSDHPSVTAMIEDLAPDMIDGLENHDFGNRPGDEN